MQTNGTNLVTFNAMTDTVDTSAGTSRTGDDLIGPSWRVFCYTSNASRRISTVPISLLRQLNRPPRRLHVQVVISASVTTSSSIT